jgi:AhpD family alkylhydroperoxidase
MSSTPRITPGDAKAIGPLAWVISWGAGRVGGTNPPNLFLTLGRNRKLFRGWLRFAGRLMPGGSLPRRETELVILRVAHLRDCDYEFSHHVTLSRRAGVHDDDVQRITEGPAATGWSSREQAILAAVDALHAEQNMDDDTWDELRTHLSEAETIEFCLLVGHYEMLATTIATLRIQSDHARSGRSTGA